ncbi:hypothetical protein PVAP13_1KG524004 [Panicum virgatum]|uniref:Uncharacterized protein n=1 Tax=Panicum virgatum TaxID=38727 RepID=A0A8T0XRK4_PANVG|nr:hypothetical protein PVAP13_1KG524004 [Panicum virgatum]
MTSAAKSETSGSEVRTPEWGMSMTRCLGRLAAAPARGSCGRRCRAQQQAHGRTAAACSRLAARGAQHLIYDVNIPAERTVRSFYGCPEDGIRLHRFRNRQDKLGLQVSHYITIPCQRHIIWMLCSTAVP